MMPLPLWAHCSLLAAEGATNHLEVIAWPSCHAGIYLHETSTVLLLREVDPAVTQCSEKWIQQSRNTGATLGTGSTIPT